MITTKNLFLLAALAISLAIIAAEQPAGDKQPGSPAPKPADATGKDQPAAPAATNPPAPGDQTGAPADDTVARPSVTNTPAASDQTPVPAAPAATAIPAPPEPPPAPVLLPNGEPGLLLNFRGVSLESVLDYLSKAAGLIINVVPGTSIKAKVDLWSGQPLSKDEALDALDTVLNQNGLAAAHSGRTLTIMPRDEIQTHDIPVILEAEPDRIPKKDLIVTQIIPVRFVEVASLIKDLQPLVSTQTRMTANEAGNAILITDTQANIHRVAEVIKAIDAGAEAVTEVRAFPLTASDPTEMAELLTSLFPDDSGRSGNSSPMQVGGLGGFASRFFGGGGRGGGGGGASSGGDSSQRIKKRARVIAVADPRTSSVVVSAAKELMDQIEVLVQQLDSNPRGKQIVHVFNLQNADISSVMPVLQDMFQKSGTQNSRNTSTQNDPFTTRANQQQTPGSSATSTTSNSRGTGNSSRGGGGNSTFP